MVSQPSPQASVVRVDARQCEVAFDGDLSCVRPAIMRGKLFEQRQIDRMPVAVGDRVILSDSDGELAIEQVLPRTNLIARRAAGDEIRRQLLATNFEQLLIVSSFGTPPFSSIMTDRILATASFEKIPTTLVLNKIDKAKRGKIKKISATYANAGLRVLMTSAETNEGVDEFAAMLKDKTSVLYGLSGVGKSSLLNCIEPGLGLKTKKVSKALSSGSHTTAFSRMWPLQIGGAVIDTQGVRVFRPFGIPAHELRLHYPEMAMLGRECSYPDCTHINEPNCVVLAAIEAGDIPKSRHRSYLELFEELKEQ